MSAGSPPPWPAPLLPLPEGFELEGGPTAEAPPQFGQDYRTNQAPPPPRVRVRLPKGKAGLGIGALGIGAVWWAFFVFWCAIARSYEDPPVIVHLLALVQVVAGVAFVYGGLVRLVNRTTLEVADGRLRVRSGPIPTFGNLEMPAKSVVRVFVTSFERSGRSGPSILLALEAIDTGGEQLTLVPGLEQPHHASYLEELLQLTLGLEDA